MSKAVNYELLHRTDYKNYNTVRGLVKNMTGFLKLAERGDTVAHSILIDVKGALYGKRSPLNNNQRRALHFNLVYDIPQYEVAEMMQTSQRMISYYVKSGLDAVRKYLMLGGDE